MPQHPPVGATSHLSAPGQCYRKHCWERVWEEIYGERLYQAWVSSMLTALTCSKGKECLKITSLLLWERQKLLCDSLVVHSLLEKKNHEKTWPGQSKIWPKLSNFCLYTSSYQWKNQGKCNNLGYVFYPGSMDLASFPGLMALRNKFQATLHFYLMLFVWRLSLESCISLTDGVRAEIHTVMLIY